MPAMVTIVDSHRLSRDTKISTLCVNHKPIHHAEKRGSAGVGLSWEALYEHNEYEGESLIALPSCSPHSGWRRCTPQE